MDAEDDNTLELTDELLDGGTDVDPNAEPQDGGDEEGFEVSFGDQVQAGSESDLIRHMRSVIKEKDAELAELRRAPVQAVEVGERPTIEGCDYDEDKYNEALDAWYARKHQAETAKASTNGAEDQEREDWNRAHQAYAQKRAALPFQDKDEVEAIALASLKDVQQAVIVKVANDPATLLYALGKSPAKLAEISTITDPLKMAAAVARLEGGLKVMPKRKTVDPDREQRGSARVSQAGPDKHEQRLEAEANRTGDRTALIQYRKQKRQAA